MNFPCLLFTDIHLTDSPATAYRWELFPWLYDVCRQEKVKELICLGDITDAKDKHSAVLVNKVVKAIAAAPVDDFRILAGNHDWLKQGEEFFRFLNQLPAVHFITYPGHDRADKDATASAYFLPFSKQPKQDWERVFDVQGKEGFDYVFMHQTVQNAVASNGQVMEGEDFPSLDRLHAHTKVYSGDIHVPQKVGRVEYVGSPYHVHFGDNFKPRCVLLTGSGKARDLHFKTVSRVALTVASIKELQKYTEQHLAKNDHVKVRMKLSEADKHDWLRIKRQAVDYLEAEGLQVHGIELLLERSKQLLDTRGRPISAPVRSMEKTVTQFVEREEMTADVMEAGLDIVGEL